MEILKKNAVLLVSQLKNWKENPRLIRKEDFERLKRQIKEFGIYKPLLVYKNGKGYDVIGGNMRLRALQDLKIAHADCWVLKFKSREEKIKLSLSDNDRVGYYDNEALKKLINPIKNKIVLEDFKVDLRIPDINLKNVLGFFSGPIGEKEVDENIETDKKCPRCGYEW